MRRLHSRPPGSQRRISVGRQRQTDAMVRLVERHPQFAEVDPLHRDAPCAERRIREAVWPQPVAAFERVDGRAEVVAVVDLDDRATLAYWWVIDDPRRR